MEAEYLYALYSEHCLALQHNGMGPAVATWTGLRDWNEAMRHGLDPWELRAIARLSYARALIEGEKMAAKQKATHGAKGQNRSR